MSSAPRVARHYHGHAHTAPVDEVQLDYDARFLRRKVLTAVSGARLLVDLAQTTSLDHGGVLVLEVAGEPRRVLVVAVVTAAPEPLLEVRGRPLHRLAWHVGNRHTPCQIEADRLVIQRDHVIRDMLERLGADIAEIVEPFTPEGGAYGHGRTHAHDHGHTHDHNNAYPAGPGHAG